MHVDHIVLLQHQLVCGLHVAENLQILPGAFNETKRNHWPLRRICNCSLSALLRKAGAFNVGAHHLLEVRSAFAAQKPSGWRIAFIQSPTRDCGLLEWNNGPENNMTDLGDAWLTVFT